MSRNTSPFAALTGAERQMKWLEYQSVRLPYIETTIDPGDKTESHMHLSPKEDIKKLSETSTTSQIPPQRELPQPPPEIPRTMADFSKTSHRQYDAVIARLKQAELYSRDSRTLL